jgi:hypothetical protein
MKLQALSSVVFFATLGLAFTGCETDYSIDIRKPALSSTSTVVCDPLSGGSGPGQTSSTNGISGTMYYLDANNPNGYTTTDQYIQYGHSPANVTFIFNQLNVPTTLFSQGFQLPDGSFLDDNQGNKLTSFFGFHFTTTLALGSDDSAGLYQLGTLSDDGMSVRLVKPDGSLDSLIEDDGDEHSVKMACAGRAISFDSTTRVPAEINWHQGPPMRLAMMLIWRKVSGTAQSLQDQNCGVADKYNYFDASTVPSTPKQYWLDLQARGWKVVAPTNFIMPGNQQNTCAKN